MDTNAMLTAHITQNWNMITIPTNETICEYQNPE